MKKRTLQVTLEVVEPSVVALDVGERVQIDRLVPLAHGYVAERRGDLLAPGVTTVSLDPGLYFFKTLSDASLKVVCGGVNAAADAPNDKDDWPDPPPRVTGPTSFGDEVPGELPTFTVQSLSSTRGMR